MREGTHEVNYKIARSTNELVELEDDWKQLEAGDADVRCFYSYEFIKAWWTSVAHQKNLQLFIISFDERIFTQLSSTV